MSDGIPNNTTSCSRYTENNTPSQMGEQEADVNTERKALLRLQHDAQQDDAVKRKRQPQDEHHRPVPGPKRGGFNMSSHTTQGDIERYRKTRCAFDGAGYDYEPKMLALLFLRMLRDGLKFQLASNMEAAGKFDDIVMRYRQSSDEDWKSMFVQLKHKQNVNKVINCPAFIGLYGSFSLVEYCHSYETMKLRSFDKFDNHKIIIFTNVRSVDNDSLVYEVEADPLLDTGGKAVSFKAGGEVYRGLCEWVDVKEALSALQGQVEGLSGEEVERKIKVALENRNFDSKTVTSFKGELLKTPTFVKLEALLTKLKPVKDKDTYSSFLAKLQVYTNQAHESKLDAKIKEEFGKVCKCSVDLEAGAMLHALQDKVKSWWQNDSFYLTQDSPLWLDVIKSQTQLLSKSTIERLTKFEVEFEESSLEILVDKINEMSCVGGILNLRVDARTAASSLRVHQALVKFRPNDIVLHVNVKAFLEREDDVLSVWAMQWCRLLVVECDKELDQARAEVIAAKILNIIDSQNKNKLLVLILPETHALNKTEEDIRVKFSTIFEDSCKWSDVTEETRKAILKTKVRVQGTKVALSDLVTSEEEFGSSDLQGKIRFRDCLAEHFELEILSELLNGAVYFGKALDTVDKIFVSRRLIKSTYPDTFSVNSVSDVKDKVVLLVAEPGMGKSTLLTHLAYASKKEDPSAWIVHIKVNDCTAYLHSMDKEKINAEAAWKFLEHCALSQGNKLEQLVFRYLEHKFIVFIDGVDEVVPCYEKQIVSLLKILKEFKITKLWVSSRPSFETKLENVLGVGAFNIAGFSKMEQKEFFNKIWKEEDYSSSDDICNEKADNLLKLFGDSLGKDASILEVPLMTAMAAEVCDRSPDKFVRNGKLDLSSLMKMFVDKKFEIYFNEKMKMENRHTPVNIGNVKKMRERTYSNHRLAALRAIFSPEEIKSLKFKGKEHLYNDLASYLKEVSNGQEKTGIIDSVIQDVPHFTHRVYAEYFAAKWLVSNFKKNPKFTNKVVFNPANKALAEFFNRILVEKHRLHEAVLNKEVEELDGLLKTQCDINELDAGGRTALHLAVLGTDLNIVKTLVEKSRVDIADSIEGWTPLQYAEHARAWNALDFLLKNGGKHIERWPKPDPAVMLDAARDASLFVVRYLVEQRGGNLDCRGKGGETMMHNAVVGGNDEILKYLVTKGLSLHFRDKEQNTTLHYAAHQNHGSVVSFLLDRGVDMDARNCRGLTAFQEAAYRGAYEVMDILLYSRASFNVSRSSKSSEVQLNASLLCAAFAGSLESVRELVTMGASVEHQDNKGHTAAWVAMHRGCYQVMDWLLLCRSSGRDTPLTRACELSELDIVNFMLSRGVDIEAKGGYGRTPLMAAAGKNKLSIIELLLEKGANVEGRDMCGKTPLHYASERGDTQAVELLLRHSARVDAADNVGWTSLHASIILKKLDVVNLLLDNSHQPDDKLTHHGYAGVTSLVAAAIKADLDTVQQLIDTFSTEREGISLINMQDSAGWTVMHFLASTGQTDVICLLLSQEGDPSIRDKHGSTPLHVAARSRHPGTVEVLLKGCREADRVAAVNTPDFNGDTAMMCAVLGGCVDCVRLLVEAGGRLSQVNSFRGTPLMVAADNDHGSVVRFVLHAFDAEREGILLKDYVYMRNKYGKTALELATPECRKLILKCLAQIWLVK